MPDKWDLQHMPVSQLFKFNYVSFEETGCFNL